MQTDVAAFAPGRVNLIGEHTDHTGGRCLPMAVAMGVTVHGRREGDRVLLSSAEVPGVADIALDVADPAAVEPAWARYVAGVVAELRPEVGFTGGLRSDVPVGAGMSSSAALEVAVALALGHDGDVEDLARRCQAAEQRATGVPCGILDQLASAAARDGHAFVLDCHTLGRTHVPVPDDVEIRVVHSGQERTLVGSAYAERRAQCEAAEALIGPLRLASPADADAIDDPVLRRRARHVTTENQRVLEAADALRSGDVVGLGTLLDEGHRSLRDDFEVSTPTVDATVARLRAQRGVHGVRLMGGGFGGCVVAVTDPGALAEGWHARPGPGAHLI
ncbi:galactokinase [Acidimicrobiia bacterium EGI L10123]|uniref:galactokinase n=1 Tax=Salinilacustrithrix flava TaxID=2957203 RepID=UPI003D7C2615|nr:galactokinase [Acidimicrobiia bacterium EGI L10123]